MDVIGKCVPCGKTSVLRNLDQNLPSTRADLRPLWSYIWYIEKNTNNRLKYSLITIFRYFPIVPCWNWVLWKIFTVDQFSAFKHGAVWRKVLLEILRNISSYAILVDIKTIFNSKSWLNMTFGHNFTQLYQRNRKVSLQSEKLRLKK